MATVKVIKNKPLEKVIHLDDGKYQVIWDFSNRLDTRFEATCDDKYWRSLKGDNLIYWFMCAIVELDEKVKKYES